MRPYRAWLAGVLVLQTAQSIAALLLPALNAHIINQGVLQGNTRVIWGLGGVMLAVTALELVAAVIAVYCSARVAMGVGRDLRTALFGRVVQLSAQEVGEVGEASLITRVTNDVQQVQLFVTGVCGTLLIAPLTLVGGVVLAARQDPGMAWLIAIALPVMAIPLSMVIRRMMPASELMQARIDRINSLLREQVIGLRVIRAFTREPQEANRLRQLMRT